MEATGTYGDLLATYLHEQDHTVSVVNPAAIKAYAPQPPLAHEDRPRRRRTDRRLLLGAEAPGLAPTRTGSAGTTSACPPPGVLNGDAHDGGEPPLLQHLGRGRPRVGRGV